MPTAEAFTAALRTDGFQEIVERELVAPVDPAQHTHPYDARLLILRGSFALTTATGRAEFAPGEACEVAAGTLHAEATGPEGATVLVGRRHPG